jgi:hypothetical protein
VAPVGAAPLLAVLKKMTGLVYVPAVALKVPGLSMRTRGWLKLGRMTTQAAEELVVP